MPTSFLKKLKNPWLCSLLVLLGAGFLIFWRLGANSMQDWDESIYAQIAHEISLSGNWLTLHWHGNPWFEKPPLDMWLIAILFKFFPATDFIARLVSATSTLGTAYIVYLLAKKMSGTLAGIISAFVLVTSEQFMENGRHAMVDPLLTFWIFLSLFFLIKVRENSTRYWYAVGISCGLAIMTKSAAGLLPLFVVCLAIITNKYYLKSLLRIDFWGALLVTLLIIVPWNLIMYRTYGHLFWDNYLGYHVLERAAKPIEGHTGTYLDYVEVIRDHFYPWSYLLIPAIGLAIATTLKTKSLSFYLTLATLAITFLLYGFGVKSILFQYIIPMYPAMAILVGIYLAKTIQQPTELSLLVLVLAVLIIILKDPSDYFFTFSTLLALWFFLKNKPSLNRLQYFGIASLIFMFIIGLQNIRPLYSQHRYNESAVLAKATYKGASQKPLITCSGAPEWSNSEYFYSDRPAVACQSSDDLVNLVKQRVSNEVVMNKNLTSEYSNKVTFNPKYETANYLFATVSLK